MSKKIMLLIFIGLVIFSVIYALSDKKKVSTDSDRAYESYLAGEELLKKLYYADAVPEFEKAVKLDTNFAMAYAMLADLYFGADEKRYAKKMADKAVSLFPKITEKERLIISALRARIYEDSESSDKYREELIQKYPNSLEGHLYKATRLMKKKDYPGAIREYKLILKDEPDYALAYNMLGYLYYWERDFEKALSNIKKYSATAGKQANPHDSHGEILMNLGRYDEAIKEFEKANKIKPDLAFVLNHLGDVYRQIGRFRDAVGYFERARVVSVNQTQELNADYNIAFTFWLAKKYDKALEIINEILASKKDHVAALILQGVIWAQDGEFEKANNNLEILDSLRTEQVEEYGELVSTESQIYTRLLRGTIALEKSDYDKAIEDFQFVVDNFQLPSILWYRILLARTYFRSGDYEKAAEILLANLEDNPNHPISLYQLSQVYKELGKTEDQRQTLLRYLSVMSGADEDVEEVIMARNQLDSLERL